ncbi:unnamed protein product [Closterium sp. Naga37s-1]|nr:unnamed protein product [Closterium sp. Naga37s-1]CAI5517223.1 unnamed protein product [Closterium sp. Naga37s-1]
MYNGIGLQTARGSGTNGYVQANKFVIRHRHTKFEAKEFQEGAGTGGISRKANKEILEHDRKRQIELKLLLLRETLEEQGYLEEEMEEQMEQARAQLEAAMREESEDQALESLGNQTHQIVARKEKKMETLKAALRINESAKEGDAPVAAAPRPRHDSRSASPAPRGGGGRGGGGSGGGRGRGGSPEVRGREDGSPVRRAGGKGRDVSPVARGGKGGSRGMMGEGKGAGGRDVSLEGRAGPAPTTTS